MIKSDLVDRVVTEVGLGRASAATALDGIIDVLLQTLSRGGRIELRGCGDFQVKDRKRGIRRSTFAAVAKPHVTRHLRDL